MGAADTVPATNRAASRPASPIEPARANGLARWSAVLAVLHGAQFLAMLAISRTEVHFTTAITYIVPRVEGGTFAGLDTRSLQIVDVPLAWLVASFFLMSATAHFLLRWPLRRQYEGWLARGMNPARWVEYAFSSTVMILAIAQLSFINEFSAVVAIAGCNVAMNLFGWSMEAANEGRAHPDWKHFIFGSIVGICRGSRSAGASSRTRSRPALGRSPDSCWPSTARSSSPSTCSRSRWCCSTPGWGAGVTT